MCDAGAWDGTQVLPPGWAAESTRPATPGAWRLAPIADSRYACLWFTGTLAGRPVAWAWGYGGQFALFVPSLRVAVATAATSPPPRDLVAQTVAISTLVSRVVAAAAAA
jgi:CubicO group peptidase (beta-lactamase class C family)